MYQWTYETPANFDNIIMNSDGEYLTKLCFLNSSDICKLDKNAKEEFLPVFKDTIRWLDLYFQGEIPSFVPKYKVNDSTPFRDLVREEMLKIPYGKVVTYHDIAKEVAKKKNILRMSSQAVGGAVGWNPICIIIPCHRVVGSNGNLTGYGGGISNKIALLELEKNDLNKFKMPKQKVS